MGWPNYKMASPSDLVPAYQQYWELFLVMGWQTLWRTVLGLLLAIVVGTAIGMIMGFSRTMRDALYPLLVGFNAIPKATVVPIVALMFVGAHDFNTVLIAFMISFFPIAVSVSIGLSTLEPEYRDILRALGASQTMIFRKIALPKTLPEFFGALKVSVTLAFIGTNLMEIVSPHGRGLVRAVRQRQDEFGLPVDVRGADRARRAGHRALLRRGRAGKDLCRLGGASAGLTAPARQRAIVIARAPR